MATEDQDTKTIKSKFLPGIKLPILGLALALGIFLLASSKHWNNRDHTPPDSFSNESIEEQSETLRINWPQKSTTLRSAGMNESHTHISPAVILEIPKQYLDAGGTYLDKNKEVEEFSIGFELPGATPLQDHPELKLERHSPEYEKFKEKWLGRFFLRLDRNNFYVPERAMSRFSDRVASGYFVNDGHLAGLIRYSSQNCSNERKDYDSDAIKPSTAEGTDDRINTECKISRRNMELISAPNAHINQFATASCVGTSCHLRFDILGRAAIINVRPKDLADWQAITSSARTLVHSFVVPREPLKTKGSTPQQ